MEKNTEEEKIILVRNYENAFVIYIGGQTLGEWISDTLSLFVVWGLFFVWIGKLPVVDALYRWTWVNDWWFLNYIIAPLGMTSLMLFSKEKGVGVWVWLYNSIRHHQEKKKPRIPFDEPKDIYG